MLQGKLLEGHCNTSHVRLLGPGSGVHAFPLNTANLKHDSLQGKLAEGDRNLGAMRLLGPGVEVHTLPRTLDITAKFPLDQALILNSATD